MSIRIKPWRTGSGWEVDIRIRWPEGGRFRARVRSPVSGKDASHRWGLAREADLLRRGKAAVELRADLDEDPSDDGDVGHGRERGGSTKKTPPTLVEFAPRFLTEFAIANGQHAAGVDGKEALLRLHLLPHLGQKRLDEITTADIQRLKAIYREGVKDPRGGWTRKPTSAAKTINNRLTVLSKLLKVACEWGEIPAMPCTVPPCVRVVVAPFGKGSEASGAMDG